MGRCLLIGFLLALLIFLPSCKSHKRSSPQAEPSQAEKTTQEKPADESNNQEQPASISAQPEATESEEEKDKTVFDLFVPGDQKVLSYNGYTIFKNYQKKVLDIQGEKYPQHVSYIVLKMKNPQGIVCQSPLHPFTPSPLHLPA